jgi:hypothetical protein
MEALSLRRWRRGMGACVQLAQGFDIGPEKPVYCRVWVALAIGLAAG